LFENVLGEIVNGLSTHVRIQLEEKLPSTLSTVLPKALALEEETGMRRSE
jgi:hypothetical protein